MAASAGHTVAYTIDPIFKHIIDYVHQWLHEYCHLKRQLSLACRHVKSQLRGGQAISALRLIMRSSKAIMPLDQNPHQTVTHSYWVRRHHNEFHLKR